MKAIGGPHVWLRSCEWFHMSELKSPPSQVTDRDGGVGPENDGGQDLPMGQAVGVLRKTDGHNDGAWFSFLFGGERQEVVFLPLCTVQRKHC